MDSRCPLELECQPDSWCPLAVMRLKAMRNAGRPLTEEEEAKLPGCPWAINHQLANYCFFNYMSKYMDKNLSDKEMASLMEISEEEVKVIQQNAFKKMKDSKAFKELIENFKGENIIEDRDSDDPFSIV